jgi:CRP-like cAMP-binding protein
MGAKANTSVEKKRGPKPPFDLGAFLTKGDGGSTTAQYVTNDAIFVQGDTADAIFYVQNGKVKITVVSNQGKEAVVAILKNGDFFGEGCLAGQRIRMSSAVAMSDCSVMKVEKALVLRLLQDEPSFNDLFMTHL